jgi:hypothetical protein
MDGPSKAGAFWATFSGNCEDADKVFLGEEKVDGPMLFEHNVGGRVYDWVPTSNVVLSLISARMQSVLRKGRFTGWHTIPAVMHHKKLGLIEGYGCLVVSGRAGPVDDNKARVEERPPRFVKGRPRMVRVGLRVDFNKWDGSDVFVPDGTRIVVVSKAVQNALVHAKITGIYFTRLDEYESVDWEATEALYGRMGME